MAAPKASAMYDAEVVAELRRQFDAADRDGDGEIDAAEACQLFASSTSPSATPEELERIASGLRNQMDADRSGTISFDEYCFRFGRRLQQEANRRRRAGEPAIPTTQIPAKQTAGDDGASSPSAAAAQLQREREELERAREALRKEREAFAREQKKAEFADEQASSARAAGNASQGSTGTPPNNGTSLPVGARVRLHSLKGAQELNGRTASVLRFDQSNGRYVVELDDGSGTKSLRQENLQVCAAGGAAAAPSSLERMRQWLWQGMAQVQMFLAGYETWQLVVGAALVLLMAISWMQVSSRYPGGSTSSSAHRTASRSSRPADPSPEFYDSGGAYGDDYGNDYGYSGGLLSNLGSAAGGGLQWYLMVGGLAYMCWKGIIPVHRMSWFQIYWLWTFLEPLLLGGGRRRRSPFGGFGGRGLFGHPRFM